MRRLIALAFALSAALSLVLTAAPPASACASCPTTFDEFVKGNDTIALVRYAGRSGGRSVYQVIDVLKGRPATTLRFKYDPTGSPRPRAGSRWLMSTFIAPDRLLAANVVFRVSANGSVIATDDGEGRVEAPETLAGWYQAIARLPETSAATPAHARAPMPTPAPTGPLMAAISLLGAVAMWRRLARNDVDSRSALAIGQDSRADRSRLGYGATRGVSPEGGVTIDTGDRGIPPTLPA